MKTIRLNRIYSHFYHAAYELLEELLRIKEMYRDNEISYNKARKRMEYLLKQIKWRCQICYDVAGMNPTQTTASCIMERATAVACWMMS